MDDDIIIEKTYEPPQLESQVPLSNIKIKSLSDHGTIIDVSPDGNCGYYAVMKGLVSLQLMDEEIPINVFRKELKDYAIKHRAFFCGTEKNMHNILIFQVIQWPLLSLNLEIREYP